MKKKYGAIEFEIPKGYELEEVTTITGVDSTYVKIAIKGPATEAEIKEIKITN